MNFAELVEKARSYRQFLEEKEIPAEQLEAMVRSAGLAPCASNLQMLRYSIITDETERKILFSGLGWAGYLTDWSGPSPGKRPSAYIVIHAPEEEKSFTGIDAGIAASYIVLAAASGGVGSCILLNFSRGTVNSVTRASGYSPMLVIALGYSAETVLLEKNNEKIRYWRDGSGAHHVPKLSLETIILKGKKQK